MAYTVYGPGIRDAVILERLLEGRGVEHALPVEKTHPVEEQAIKNALDRGREQAARYQRTAQFNPKPREPALVAEQIMSKPVVSVFEDDSIAAVWAIFRERRFRHIPVLSREKHLVGILSDRDLLRYAATHGRVPPFGENTPEATRSVQGLYKHRVLTATPDTEIRQIARILLEQRIGAMPIVDDAGVLHGMITRSDILRTLVHHMPLELWV